MQSVCTVWHSMNVSPKTPVTGLMGRRCINCFGAESLMVKDLPGWNVAISSSLPLLGAKGHVTLNAIGERIPCYVVGSPSKVDGSLIRYFLFDVHNHVYLNAIPTKTDRVRKYTKITVTSLRHFVVPSGAHHFAGVQMGN